MLKIATLALVLLTCGVAEARHKPPPPDTANKAFAPLRAREAAKAKSKLVQKKHDKYAHPTK